MTKEEFNEIIEPLHLLGEKHRRCLIAALNRNFEEHQKITGQKHKLPMHDETMKGLDGLTIIGL